MLHMLYLIPISNTRLILPFLQEYEDAGEFTFTDKIKRSLFVNGIYYLVGLGVGMLYAAYYISTNGFSW